MSSNESTTGSESRRSYPEMSGLEVAHAIGERLLAAKFLAFSSAADTADALLEEGQMSAEAHRQFVNAIDLHFHQLARPILQFIRELEANPAGEVHQMIFEEFGPPHRPGDE